MPVPHVHDHAGATRRPALLLLAAAAAAPLFASAPADASIYCGSFGPIERAWGPVCGVKCTVENPPQIDPSKVPPVWLPHASCMYED